MYKTFSWDQDKRIPAGSFEENRVLNNKPGQRIMQLSAILEVSVASNKTQCLTYV